jgi:hypothetical protein
MLERLVTRIGQFDDGHKLNSYLSGMITKDQKAIKQSNPNMLQRPNTM